MKILKEFCLLLVLASWALIACSTTNRLATIQLLQMLLLDYAYNNDYMAGILLGQARSRAAYLSSSSLQFTAPRTITQLPFCTTFHT
jgi:hypothetical protein